MVTNGTSNQNVSEHEALVEQLQQACHEFTEFVSNKKPDARYEDLFRVWVFQKLAEIELRLRKFEGK